VENFQKILPFILEDISVQSGKFSFFGPAKTRAAALHKITLV